MRKLEKQTTTIMDRVIVHPRTRCWIWTGYFNSQGYGSIRINGEVFGAHRLSYELFKGEIPEESDDYHGICVLHRCDNPKCVNPEHLFLGTHQDNMRDMFKKNRRSIPAGSMHGRAKLDESKVIQIKRQIQNGETDAALAEVYGVSGTAIWQIRRGKNWAHVEVPT